MPWTRVPWVLVFLLACGSATSAGSWPQFRGPNASGLADAGQALPAQISPEQNVQWKVVVPAGHSSPIVHGKRVFLTAVRDGRLVVLALDRSTGKVLWQEEAPHRTLEQVHQVGNQAQATSATDGQVVVSFFGSSGLIGHDVSGKRLWHLPMGPFKNDFGAGSSPILAGDRVILCQDHDTDSFLMAVDKNTGKLLWKADRAEFPRNYATPVIWENAGRKQVVVVGTLRAIGYDLETGREAWTVRGLARIVNMTPLVGTDGILYIAAWSPGGDENDRINVPTFDELLSKQDKNGNGTIEADEAPAGPIKERFTQIDRDKDGHITRAEYEDMRRIFEEARNVCIAVKPGGNGDITQTHVLWTQSKLLPYVPSPLFYKGHLFLVKNGGLLSCLDARTGTPTKQGRVFGGANYFASPVAGDGKIYTISQRGELSVISAEPEWKILGRARFEEDVFATPAIADGRIYVRTAGHLYCFGQSAAE